MCGKGIKLNVSYPTHISQWYNTTLPAVVEEVDDAVDGVPPVPVAPPSNPDIKFPTMSANTVSLVCWKRKNNIRIIVLLGTDSQSFL